ncbi:MAG: hypothetical protein AAB295_11045 [Chloroflexota bacterium]
MLHHFLLAALQGGSEPALYLNWQPGLLDEPGLGSTVAVTGDVDFDGAQDLIISDMTWYHGYRQVSLISSANGRTLLDWRNLPYQSRGQLLGPGDLNLDGIPDVLIQVGYDFMAFSGSDGALIRTYGTGSNSSSYDGLVALGDVDLDAVPDFAYCSSDHDAGSTYSVGIVGALSGATGAPVFTLTGSAAYDSLGTGIARLRDHDLDGCDDLLVFAPKQLRIRLHSGRTGALLREYAGPRLGEEFPPSSAADAGDVDHDGYHDFIVGLPNSSFAGSHAPGSALLISGASGALLRAWDGAERDEDFGYQVAGGGDFDGDGDVEVLVRARFTSAGGMPNAGGLTLFDATTGAAVAAWRGEKISQEFGQDPAFLGDVSGDGRVDLVFGLGNHAPERLQIWCWEAWLRAGARAVSASASSILTWDLDFPQPAAGARFRVLLSASGRGPSSHGITIPLTMDALLSATARGIYPRPIVPLRMEGTLDAAGAAEAACAFPSGSLTPWIGRTLFVAAVALHASGRPLACSSSLELLILP